MWQSARFGKKLHFHHPIVCILRLDTKLETENIPRTTFHYILCAKKIEYTLLACASTTYQVHHCFCIINNFLYTPSFSIRRLSTYHKTTCFVAPSMPSIIFYLFRLTSSCFLSFSTHCIKKQKSCHLSQFLVHISYYRLWRKAPQSHQLLIPTTV